MRLLCASVVLVASTALAQRPLLLADKELPPAKLFELQREAAPRGVEVAAPEPRPDPASEEVLAPVRPLYKNLLWKRAEAKLDAGVEALLRGREPTPGVVRALAEVELWRGAVRVFLRDARGAADHFALAKQLHPKVKLEPLFPPKVKAAFRAAKPGKPVPVDLRVAPVGAQVWLDGRAVSAPLRASPGLHYVVATRADRVPEARLVRLTQGSAQINVNLREVAPQAEMLRAARWLGVDEGVRDSLYVVSFSDGKFRVSTAKAPLVEAESAEEVVRKVCEAAEGCISPSPAPVVVVASPPPVIQLVATPPPPQKPVWKRGWFWGVIAAAAVVVIGVSVGAGVGATAQQDYVVRVR
jgi:hypothetical protein